MHLCLCCIHVKVKCSQSIDLSTSNAEKCYIKFDNSTFFCILRHYEKGLQKTIALKECVSTNRHAFHCYCLHLTWEIYPITKNRQEKYFFIAFLLKYVRMSKCIPTMVAGFLWIQISKRKSEFLDH